MKNQTNARKRLNLQQIIRDGKPVWVINTSAKYAKTIGKNRGGDVVFQIGTGDTIDKVVIPMGPDPVCVSDQVDSTSLSSCRDLLRLVNKGVLELLDPEKADEYYEKNEARLSRLQQRIENQRSSQPLVQAQSTVPQSKENAPQSIDPMITNVLNKIAHNQISKDDALEVFIQNSDNFGAHDFDYLLKAEHSTPDIRNWASEKIQNTNTQK